MAFISDPRALADTFAQSYCRHQSLLSHLLVLESSEKSDTELPSLFSTRTQRCADRQSCAAATPLVPLNQTGRHATQGGPN